MALLHIDSFDHLATADLEKKYESAVGALSVGAVGRYNTNGLQVSGSAASAQYLWLQTPLVTTLIVGFAFKYSALTTNAPILTFHCVPTQAHVYIDILSSTKQLRARNSNVFSPTVFGVGDTVLAPNKWYFIEVKTFVNSSGSINIRIDEVDETWSSGTGTGNTINGNFPSITHCRFGCDTSLSGSVNGTMFFDDIYVCDTSGGSHNNFLGDHHVIALKPTGAGNSNDWSDDYEEVDDATPDDDSTYSEANTGKQLYTFEDLPTSGMSGVSALQISAYARKTATGDKKINSVARLSSTETDSAVVGLQESYRYFSDIRTTKPGGGSWDASDVDSAEFGLEVA